MPKKRRDQDKLIVQVALKIKLPSGAKITKKVLQEIVSRIANNQELPRNVDIRGIFWRNPNRRGSLSYWRYHRGADLSAAPSPLESRPRGSLQDAIDTLAPFIENGDVTF